MLESSTYLLVILSLTSILAVIGVKVGGIIGVVHVCQAAYWTISYVFRPAVLLIFQPPPAFGDSLADWRIASGGYETAMPHILAPVVWGLGIYIALAAGVAWIRSRRGPRATGQILKPFGSEPEIVATFLVAYSAGWIFRFILLAVGGSVAETLAGLAVAGAAGLVVFSRGSSVRMRMGLLGPLLGELLWSVLSASKTPIIAAVLALAIRWAALGWNKRKIRWSLGVGAAVIVTFPLLQSIKTDAEVQQVLQAADANYPTYLHPLMSLLRRFDLFSAVTDATLLDGRHWMDASEFVGRFLSSLVPQTFLGSEKVGVGTLWSMEVRSASLGRANSEVSLAEGFIAEGYALNGMLGVIIGAVFILGLAYFADSAIRSNRIFVVSLGLLLVSYPILFERGILGSMETLGKSLQVAALVWLVSLVVRQCFRWGGSGYSVRQGVHVQKFSADSIRSERGISRTSL